MAPEIILQGTKYNHQVDVWSIGVITFELLVGFLPFMAEDYHKFRGVVAEGDFKIRFFERIDSITSKLAIIMPKITNAQINILAF